MLLECDCFDKRGDSLRVILAMADTVGLEMVQGMFFPWIAGKIIRGEIAASAF